MSAQPTGTITFLFTDIEGSSKLWEEYPEPMRKALAVHDRILREAFQSRGGFIFKTIGDAFCVAFDKAHDGLGAALEGQRRIHAEKWDGIGAIRVRMALHTGAAEQRDGDYFGQTLNRVSRILAAAHGGQTLISLAAQELVRDYLPNGAQLRELGERRLRDLARPEHIYQLVANDLPSEFPPLRSLESVPNNLPIQLTSFIGREKEMNEVRQLMGGTHLLTLTGMGGTGKTRLSLQVAAEMLERFPDGVWFIEFATIDNEAVVPETVAGVLNVRQEAGQPLVGTLTAFLLTKTLLLIFDNCEHVVAGCARLAEALLRACPSLVIMASSREPLGIAGETAWPLAPLSIPDKWREAAGKPKALEEMSEYEAVRLFADRAAAAQSGFRLTEENIAAVVQICWRLDGIPLAIELAAARSKVLTVEQIAARLDDRFHLLTGGSRTSVPRQQTLRALIDWSHDLLSEPERKLLRRLSVFARGRNLDGIEAVCSSDDLKEWEIIDLLTQLVDKSLVTVESSPEHGARYFMTESIWDYCHEKLIEAGEMDPMRVKHLDYYLKMVEEAKPKTMGADQRRWLERLDEENINFRFALEASLELPGQAPKGLRMVTALQRYVEIRGLLKEVRDVLADLLKHPDTSARNVVRAKALAMASRLAWVSDDYGTCRELGSEALGIFRELGDPYGIATMLGDLALFAWDEDEDAAAQTYLDEAFALAGSVNEKRLNAQLVRVKAMLASGKDYAEAFSLSSESVALYREIGDVWMAGIVGWGVGINAAALGRYEEARGYFEACLRGARELGNRWAVPFSLEAFAALAVADQHYARAARLLGAAEALRAKHSLSLRQTDHPALRKLLDDAAEHFAGEESAAARRDGRELSIEDAVAFALEN